MAEKNKVAKPKERHCPEVKFSKPNNYIESNSRKSFKLTFPRTLKHELPLHLSNPSQAKVQEPKNNKWIAPPLDVFKANWDAAIDKGNSRLGIGVIVRNSEGSVMASLCSSMDLIPDPLLGEAVAARRASSFCAELGLQHIILEGDSLSVVKAIQHKEDSWSDTRLVIRDIKIMLSKTRSWSVLHVHREVNVIAHHLAKFALSCQEDCILIEDYPPCIQHLL
ncbi:uncharacterized protein LOC118349877 [Juglans regia]|uniref:Uncharacterized protein LOC118349877 n=1 Tax=Juglans regia TaxID=51240 RepID=A0A6P9FAR1_JUGRE|nr:uncharacterized protein LOC118349877 [Juglans regia]